MNSAPSVSDSCPQGDFSIRGFCYGDPAGLERALREDRRHPLLCLLWIVLGGAAYGATLGMWQWGTPQPLYVAIKIPLLFVLTAVGNGILNGMLAQLLGVPLSFRESLSSILTSFAIMALILGSLFPVISLLVMNTPSPDESGFRSGYSFTMVFHVLLIAFAGVMANLRLLGLLRRLSPTPAIAMQTLAAWLSGNLLLGSQLSWNLRPFIGSPHLEVEFFRPDAFSGSFFEALWHSFIHLM